jgi:biopolymer transport protein TolR
MNKRQRRGRLVSEINITPFTDVILVLLIIFMITTPLIRELDIKVNLPEAKSGTPGENVQQAEASITITREGVIYLDGKPVTKRELKEKISVMHRKNPDLSVVMRSDKMTLFKNVVSVLDVLTEANIKNLNITAIAEKE